ARTRRQPPIHPHPRAASSFVVCGCFGFEGGDMTLSPGDLAALAQLVTDEIQARRLVESRPGLVDATELAALLGVERGYVYENATRLGAIRLGEGPRARLRFNPEEASARLRSCHGVRTSEVAKPASSQRLPRRHGRPLGTNVPLLPIRGIEPS